MRPLPDIAGAGATVQVVHPALFGRWVQILVSGTDDTLVARLGDSVDVSASFGFPMVTGSSFFAPYIGSGSGFNPYSLAGIWMYIPVGLNVSVLYNPCQP